MKKEIALLLFIQCIVVFCGTNSCPGFNAGDLLQSGKNAIMRGKIGGNPEYSYEAPVNFPIPSSGMQIAVTTGTIGDYNPIPTYGYNYYIEAQRKPNSNTIIYKLIMNNDESWTTIQLSYLVCGRNDMSIGNFQTPVNQWISSGSSVYNVNYKIKKNLPKANYNIAAFISGFSTTDDQFTLTVSQKTYNHNQKKITIGFYCSANPTVLTLTISYIIFPQIHQYLDMSYEVVPRSQLGSYQISGPVNFQPNKKIQYNQWRVDNRNLACTGNQCSNNCVLRQQCTNNNGNIFQDQCIYCAPGVIFQFGRCSKKCGSNQVYLNRVCVCSNGFKKIGKDCVKDKVCGTNQQHDNRQNKCVCKKGFAEYKGQCRQCPAGSTATSNGDTCVCDSNNQIYDEKSNKCKERCLQNQQWILSKCQCLDKHAWWNQKCRKCPNNAQVSSDQSTCLCRSSTAYYNPQKNDCVECGVNFQLSKNKCVCKNGYTLQNGVCIVTQKCKDNEQYNNQTKKCQCKTGYSLGRNNICVVSCKANQIFNVRNGKCQCTQGFSKGNNGVCTQPCQGDLVWDGKSCICPKGWVKYGGSCKKCPKGSLPNAQRTACICNGNQIFSINSFSCSVCPANSKPKSDQTECVCNNGFVKSGASCIPNCGPNQQFDSTRGKCECNLGFYKPDNKHCVSRCKVNEQWNGKKCICKSGYGLFNNLCSKCPSDAKGNSARTSCTCNIPNFIFNPSTFKCQSCYANSHNSEDDTKCICNNGFQQSGNSCIPICDINEEISTKTNGCDCKYGFIRVGPVCVERCGLNEEWNGKCLCKLNHVKSNGVCKPCPSGLTTNPLRTVCQCKDSKQFFNINKLICQTCPINSIPNDDFSDFRCLSGYKREGESCISSCPTGAVPDVNGNCLCAGGLVLQGNTCTQPISCPPRSSWNTQSLQCKCNTKGENIINGECKSCGDNSFYSINDKKCACSTGFFMIGGVCTVCDPKTKYNGTDCVCNLGYYGNRDKCQSCHASCIRCTGPQANQCESCSDVSLVLQKGFCSKNSPCDPGLFLDGSSCTKCSDNCIVCQDLFKCSQCAIGYKVAKIQAAGQTVEACNEICGDGIKYQAECDDGNTNDGDGCSSKCTIQPGWSCSGGSSAQKSKCNKYIPDQTIITQKGTVNLGDRVIQSVRASYLPTCLTDGQCNKCFKVLIANVIDANVPILVKVNFVPLSQYQFLIEYNFQGLIVTSKFKTVIKLNQQFKGCLAEEDFNQQLELEIDPAFLALVDTEGSLTADQLLAPSAVDPNKIIVPAGANQILGLS